VAPEGEVFEVKVDGVVVRLKKVGAQETLYLASVGQQTLK
jgi:hypothetical protein